MFFLGLIRGVLLVVLAVAWLVHSVEHNATPVHSFTARQTIWDIERRTMHELLAAELAAQRAGCIDGSAVEERQP
jgi:hypothetical protein